MPSIGIIGGADGPTKIIVTRTSPPLWIWLVAAAIAVIVICAVIRYVRNHFSH